MPVAQRSAEVIWNGNLAQGTGTVTAGTRAFSQLPVSWPARTEQPDGKTSPEELIAAAQASCYSMALSHALSQGGHVPTKLHVAALCTLERVGQGLKVTSVDLEVRGEVPGIDQATFARIAEEAEKGCPVSNALRNNVEIRVTAHLQGAQQAT